MMTSEWLLTMVSLHLADFAGHSLWSKTTIVSVKADSNEVQFGSKKILFLFSGGRKRPQYPLEETSILQNGKMYTLKYQDFRLESGPVVKVTTVKCKYYHRVSIVPSLHQSKYSGNVKYSRL